MREHSSARAGEWECLETTPRRLASLSRSAKSAFQRLAVAFQGLAVAFQLPAVAFQRLLLPLNFPNIPTWQMACEKIPHTLYILYTHVLCIHST